MNTIIEATFYGKDGSQLVSSELNRIEGLLSVTKDNSDIGRINSSDGNLVEVSEDTKNVLTTAIDIYNESDGDFDPTIYPIVELWGFTTDNYRIPSEEELNKAMSLVDFSKVKLTDNTVAVPEGVKLDLGGIGKGYAGEKCCEILKANDITSAILSIGGNVQTVGLKPDGSLWTVALKNPDGGENLCKIKVGECAVVTSGGYERYFEEDGKRYHHIIDPKTGKPAESEYKSVTIICSDGARADALSTAFYIGGEKLIKEYLNKYSDLNVILYTNDNELFITREISDSVTLSGAVSEDKLYYID